MNDQTQQISKADLDRLFPKASQSTLARNLGSIAPQQQVPTTVETHTQREHKYRAQPTVVDGIRFASKRESERYAQLKLLEKAGDITHLLLQPKFPITVNGIVVCKYVADFSYRRRPNVIIEDVKGFKTPIYRLKKKLFEACYPGLKITEL